MTMNVKVQEQTKLYFEIVTNSYIAVGCQAKEIFVIIEKKRRKKEKTFVFPARKN